jgi:hypothetical protein
MASSNIECFSGGTSARLKSHLYCCAPESSGLTSFAAKEKANKTTQPSSKSVKKTV